MQAPKISIKKIIYNKSLKLTLGGTFLAWFFGMLIACVVLNLYAGLWDFLQVNKQKSDYDYTIIHKKIGVMNTFGLSKSNFTNKELQKLKEEEFIQDLAPVLSNQFKVGIDGGDMLRFYTELFLQSAPNKFLDVDTSGFNWQEGREVPIVVANSFIDLYNHGFAVSQGLPQLPKGIITKKTLYLKIRGNGKSVKVPCRIYAFSDRISSILVPDEFLLWANDKFGDGKEMEKIESVLIQSNADQGTELEQFLESNSYEYNKEMISLDNSKQLINGVMLFLLFISILVITLSIGLSYFIAQTLMYEKANFIKHLSWLGYQRKYLLKKLFQPVLSIGLMAIFLVFLVAYMINANLYTVLQEFNFEISSISMVFVLFWLLGSLFSMLLIWLKMKRSLFKFID